jgi:DnaK suppressor protein
MNARTTGASLSAAELRLLHEKLIQLRTEMSGRRNRRLSEALAPEGDVGDEGESAAHAYEQHTSANLAEAERNELALIDSALERIQQGIYGLDIETGEPIGFARLLAVPWALRAVAREEQRTK